MASEEEHLDIEDVEAKKLKAASKLRIREALVRNQQLLQEKVDQFKDDPQNCPPDFIIALLNNKKTIDDDKPYSDFESSDHLWVLDELENWFTSKKLSFPNPSWLAASRARLNQKSDAAPTRTLRDSD